MSDEPGWVDVVDTWPPCPHRVQIGERWLGCDLSAAHVTEEHEVTGTAYPGVGPVELVGSTANVTIRWTVSDDPS